MAKDSDWIWEALALGEESLLKNAEVDFFDWNGTHEKYGTPLIALVVGKAAGQEVYDFATGTPEKLQERLNLMELVIKKGASPHVKPPQQFSICKSWWKTEGDKEVENSRTPLVHFNEKSAYGVVAACLEALTNVEGDWRRELRFLRDAAKILASYRSSTLNGQSVARVPVAEDVVDTWERILRNKDNAEVSIVCHGTRYPRREGMPEVETVLAHAMVLKSCSPVLKAMLSPAFKEGASAKIEVDTDAAAVRQLLALIYTGEEIEDIDPSEPSSNDVSTDVLLGALELAHQWDVGHAVAALELAASKRIDEENFGKMADAGARLQLAGLIEACMSYAKSSSAVAKAFRSWSFSGPVMGLLVKALGDPEEGSTHRKKRRRTLSLP